MSFRVARLEPQGMRLSVIDGGVAKTTVEASSITVTTGPDGTTVTAEGTATVAMGDRTKISVEGLTLLLRPGGKLSGVSWSGLRQ